jgi:zinc transporter 1
MKNTFGWARIDIVTMLVCCVLLASFCFSLIVEALQTLVHIDHLDEMHHPLPVMSIGASGILLNAFCYFLIGGYTFNQGMFLHFTQDGDVILKRSTRLLFHFFPFLSIIFIGTPIFPSFD